MEVQQLRALRAVFYAAAFGALKAATNSRSYEQFEARMAAGWAIFVPNTCCRIFTRWCARCSLPRLCSVKWTRWSSTSAATGKPAHARRFCACAPDALRTALEAEIDAAGNEIVARHAAEGRTP